MKGLSNIGKSLLLSNLYIHEFNFKEIKNKLPGSNLNIPRGLLPVTKMEQETIKRTSRLDDLLGEYLDFDIKGSLGINFLEYLELPDHYKFTLTSKLQDIALEATRIAEREEKERQRRMNK